MSESNKGMSYDGRPSSARLGSEEEDDDEDGSAFDISREAEDNRTKNLSHR